MSMQSGQRVHLFMHVITDQPVQPRLQGHVQFLSRIIGPTRRELPSERQCPFLVSGPSEAALSCGGDPLAASRLDQFGFARIAKSPSRRSRQIFPTSSSQNSRASTPVRGSYIHMNCQVVSVPTDGEYPQWEILLATRYPLALSEMRWPSVVRRTLDSAPTARWGIECGTGWRHIVEKLLERLETAIAAQPIGRRDVFRIVQIKEKFGRLTVYLASEGSAEMRAAIQDAAEQSVITCEVCSAPGRLEERHGWWSAKCAAHVNWSPLDRLT